jgi:hypothetical protein
MSEHAPAAGPMAVRPGRCGTADRSRGHEHDTGDAPAPRRAGPIAGEGAASGGVVAKRVGGAEQKCIGSGRLVVSGTLIPDRQWFEDVDRAARDARVAGGGDPEAEQAGLPGLGAAMGRDTLVNKRDEYLAARDAMQGLSDRYQRLLNESERAGYVHLREARVFSPGDPPLPGNGMYRRGRL